MATLTIDKMQKQARCIAGGQGKVRPGQPYRISEAASVGDGVWQGDLGLEIVARVPKGYVRVEHPTKADLQLVPGSTEGSRHCLDSFDGVELYRPENWPNVEPTPHPIHGGKDVGYFGPCMVLTQERTIPHPKHGPVIIPGTFTILTRYQREFDAEQQRERRNAD